MPAPNSKNQHLFESRVFSGNERFTGAVPQVEPRIAARVTDGQANKQQVAASAIRCLFAPFH
jgi:hypothetical protein